ncbi:MAG: hypothetical protein KAJ01_06765, partial [Candidatus Hydrogenedentes bacterium]|nr:hypothetical protein [Candidatus Hydrogenedentota bacterium]
MADEIRAGIRLTAQNETARAFKDFETQSKKSTTAVKKQFDVLAASMKKVGLGLTAVGAVGVGLTAKTTLLAARVETLGVVLKTVGGHAGYSAAQLQEFEDAVKSQGITTQVARTALTRMMQAQLDLTKSTDLARIAQDAAVIAGINSSEAFNNMIYAINTLNPRVLKTMGLTISLEQAYSEYAKTQGITVNQITMQTKKQIAMNEVIKAGSMITGAYTSAMDTAGKKMSSLSRHFEEAGVALGQAFLPLFSALIDLVTKLIKGFNSLSPAMKEFIGATIGAASAMALLSGASIMVLPKIAALIKTVAPMGLALQQASASALMAGKSIGPFSAALLGGASAATATAVTLGVLALAFVAVAAAIGKVIQFYNQIKRENADLTAVLKEHNREIAESDMTQEEYNAELRRSVGLANSTIWATKKTIVSQKEYNQIIKDGADKLDASRKYVIAYTEAEREMARSVVEAADRQRNLTAETERWTAQAEHFVEITEHSAETLENIFGPALENINYMIGVELGGSIDQHREKMGTLKDKYGDVQGELEALIEKYPDWIDVEGSWANQQKSEILGRLDDLTGKIDEEAAAWERSTNQIMLNMAARALEALPVDVQAAAIAALSVELGLMDPSAAVAFEKMGELTSLLAADKITVDEFAGGVETLGRYMDELPPNTLSEIEVRVTATGDLWILTGIGMGGETIPYLEGQDTSTGTATQSAWSPTTSSGKDTGGGGGLQPRQAGGYLAEWTMVGEAGAELITPWGYVVDASTTRKLMGAGFRPGRRRGIDPGFEPTPPEVTYGGGGGGASYDPETYPGGGGGITYDPETYPGDVKP